MLFINRLVLIGLLGAGITVATTAQAAVKLFTAEWYTESFGNECDGTALNGSGYMVSPGGGADTKCTRVTPDFSKYSVFAVPMGFQCNVYADGHLVGAEILREIVHLCWWYNHAPGQGRHGPRDDDISDSAGLSK